MPYHSPERKLEIAVETYLKQLALNALDGFVFIRRFETTAIAFPCLQIFCEEAKALDEQYVTATENGLSGNWSCRVTISLKTDFARTTGEVHDEAFAAVRDLFLDSELISGLQAVMADYDFTAVRWAPDLAKHSVEHDKDRISALEGDMWVAPSKLA